VALGLTLAFVSCGDNEPPSRALPYQLTVSPSMQLLKPGAVSPFTFTVLARRGDAPLEPAPRTTVDFTLEDDPSTAEPEPRGATLSTASLVTDEQGQATVQVTAGLETTFLLLGRLRAAPLEASAVIIVNEKGSSSTLEVDPLLPTVSGLVLDKVQVRLFDGRPCRTLHVSPPSTSIRPAVEVALGATATFALVAGASAVQGIGYDSAGHVRAAGCVDVPQGALKANATTRVALPLAPPVPTYASRFELKTLFSANNLAATALGPWQDLAACRLGPEAAWLDALISTLRASGATDAAVAFEAQRGPRTGTPACPADTKPGGGVSLDRILGDAFPAAAPTTSTRAAVAADVMAFFDNLVMTSTLSLASTPEEGRYDATHTFGSLAFNLRGASASAKGAVFGFPGQTAFDVPIVVQPDGSWLIGSHAFAAELGTLSLAALPELVFRPRGLPEDVEAWLGSWIAEASPATATTGADAGASPSAGCASLDRKLCTAAGRSAGCLGNLCQEATAQLAATLTDALRSLDGPGANVLLAGSALPWDADGDGVLDSLGSSTSPGLWSLTLTTSTGARTVDATFTGKPPLN